MAGKTISNLHVGISGGYGGLAKTFTGAADAAENFVGKIARVGAMFIGGGAAFELGRKAMDSLTESLKTGFETADHIENVQAALVGLAGSADNAKSIVEQLKQVASTPPFGFDEVALAAKKLLSAGVASDKIIGIVNNLGDVSVGTGASLESLTEIFARAATEGSVGTRELNEAARQGIPIVQALADEYHTNQAGVQAMAAAGSLSFNDLTAAFQRMSATGGRFAGLAASQANTLGGAYKTLTSNVTFGFADIADSISTAIDLTGIIKNVTAAVPQITSAIQNAFGIIAPYIQQVESYIAAMAGDAFGWIVANWQGIVGFTGTALGEVYNTFTGLASGISDAAANLWTAVSGVWTDGCNLLSQSLATVEENTGGSIGGITGFFSELGLKLTEVFGNIGVYAKNWESALTVIFAKVGKGLAEVANGWADFYDWLNAENGDTTHAQDATQKWVDAWSTAQQQAQENFDKGAAATIITQEEAAKKIKESTAKVFSNIFKSKDFLKPEIKSPPAIAFKASLVPESMDLKITPKIESAKLLKYGSAAAQLAVFKTPGLAGSAAGPGPGAVAAHRPAAAPVPLPPPAPSIVSSDDKVAKAISDGIALLGRYIVKWDTNPPLGEATF